MKNKTISIRGVQIPLYITLLLFCCIISFLFEIFFFNRAHFRMLGENIENPPIYLDDGSELIYDEYYSFEDGFTLTIPDINQDIRNYYLDIEDYSNDSWNSRDFSRLTAFHIVNSITDEGNANYYSFGELLVSPEIDSSMYIFLEPYGKVSDLKITFTEGVDEICFSGVYLNKRPPVYFNVIRMIILALLLFSIIAVVNAVYECNCKRPNERKRIIVLLITAILLSVIATSIQKQNLMHGMQKGYPDLARSLAEGNVYIEESTDDVLLNMDNPYDRTLRDALGADYYWDVAYYEGKYYIYFGVVPAIIFHLPYYLITGNDLYYDHAQMLMNILILLGALALIEIIRKKYYEYLPIHMEILIYITTMFAIGLGILVKRSAIYYEAIGTAIMLVLWGLYFWLRSVRDNEVSLWQGMLGSLFMALSVGARPQFAVASFAAFYIYRQAFREKKIKTIVLLILPYIPIAIALMMYNYARFGSVFDFGANYNLTTHDMTHIGLHLARIPMGIWYYLIKIPIFDYVFPYMKRDTVGGVYQGFIAWEEQAGGTIALTPYLFLGLSAIKKKSDEGMLVKISMVTALVVVIMDSVMCGISMRYQLDYRLLLAVPVMVYNLKQMKVLCNEGDELKLNKYCHVTSLLCMGTILLGILTFLCQYEVCDYSDLGTNPVFYCWLRDFFSGSIF